MPGVADDLPSGMAARQERRPGPPSLHNIALLADLTAAEREALARRCLWRRPAAGEQVVEIGAASDEAWFIVEGTLRVVYFAPSGREIAYAQVHAGGHVGEFGLLDGGVRSASVVAGKACLLAQMPKALFEEMLAAYPAVARRLLVHLVRVIRDTDRKLTEFGLVGAIPRVYRELLRLAGPHQDESLVISPLPTQGELAALAGTTRETVARALAQLAKQGVAVREGRRLIVAAPARLAAMALPSELDGIAPQV